MRAYIEEPEGWVNWDTMYDTETKVHSAAAYIFDTEEGGKTALIPMEPKKWYIEYPEQELIVEDAPTVKVRVDITGLNNEQVIDLLTALNEAGFEAELAIVRTEEEKRQDWTPLPNLPNWYDWKPVPQYPIVTYTNQPKTENSSYFTKYGDLHELPGQMGIHEMLEDE